MTITAQEGVRCLVSDDHGDTQQFHGARTLGDTARFFLDLSGR